MKDRRKILPPVHSTLKSGPLTAVRCLSGHFFVTLILLASLMPVPLLGQTKETGATSPTINTDNSVTFRYHAPDAERVFIKGSFLGDAYRVRTSAGVFSKQGRRQMRKDGDEWVFTSEPLSPELYTFSFTVDDKDITDSRYYFIIEGGIADDYVDHDVPHGKVSKVWYPSSMAGTPRRRMSVYTPAGYDDDSSKLYPVLYLLHGSGGDEDAWLESGRAAQILDNMISRGDAVPMLVVMPNGIVGLASAPGSDPDNPDVTGSAVSPESMMGKFESSFMKDIVSFVEDRYRVSGNKEDRAIAGLSMGGLHTIFISANNPGTFDYVGLFSAQTTNALDDDKISRIRSISDGVAALAGLFRPSDNSAKLDVEGIEVYSGLEGKLKKQFEASPELYYIAVGKDDFVMKLNDDFRARLDSAGFRYTYHETDGGHDWSNWRKYLVDFLPRLFRHQ